MAKVIITGDRAIDRTLRDLPKNIRVSAIRAAARKAAKPLITNARQILVASSSTTSKDGQSKLAYVSRNIKAVALRSKDNPGVYVGVKGNDIPVGKRFWDIRAYAILLGEGSYKSGVRVTRGTGASRGRFRGLGNFITASAMRTGNLPYEIMFRGIDEEVNKALKRSIHRGR